ncbi:MAG: hypothetical protein QXX17_05130 [Conexivisphaerales archaeon]
MYVANSLALDWNEYGTGNIHDEMKRIDVQLQAVRILNAKGNVLFITSEEIPSESMFIDDAKRANYTIVTIPRNLRYKLIWIRNIEGNPIMHLDQFKKKYYEIFQFKFVDVEEFNENERRVFNLTDKIFEMVGGRPDIINEVKISETTRPRSIFVGADGVWGEKKGWIIIKRYDLRHLESYASTLLHETAHATSDAQDVDRDFELKLTEYLGVIVAKMFKSMSNRITDYSVNR